MPLSNAKIWEAIRRVIEEESAADVNNVPVDKFSHASNTQKQNVHMIFTSENLDESDEMVDAVNNFTISDAEYYESNRYIKSR